MRKAVLASALAALSLLAACGSTTAEVKTEDTVPAAMEDTSSSPDAEVNVEVDAGAGMEAQ